MRWQFVQQWDQYKVGDWHYNGRRYLGRITAIWTNGMAARFYLEK